MSSPPPLPPMAAHPPPCGEPKPKTPRFYNGPNGERWVTARQEGVKGVGLKYVGTRKLSAVVRRPTKFSLTTIYRRLMEWKGKVSGDSHEVLEHLLTKGDVIRLTENKFCLPARFGPQLAAWGTGENRNCRIRASHHGAYLELIKDIEHGDFLCTGYGSNFTAKTTGWESAKPKASPSSQTKRRRDRRFKQARDKNGRFIKTPF